MKRNVKAFLSVLLCLGLACSGCSKKPPASDTEPSITLPPVQQPYTAPIGDALLEYSAPATLYLPRYGSNVLGSVLKQVSFSAARPQSESLVRALLNQQETSTHTSLGGGVKLSLYGVNPVEQSRNAATVNLGASALQMDRKALYIACQAITNTLTELSEIDHVNFLVVDRAVGMDVANTLPMGAFSRSIGTDSGAAYEQLMQRRVDVTEAASDKPLNADVTLYFPLAHTPGILSEVRNCSFSNQLPEDMIVVLLQEMSRGSMENINTPQLPLLADLLVNKPKVVDTDENGRLIELDFAYNLDEMLAANNISQANCMASLCHTLCTFFPGISGIRVTVGDKPIESVMLTEQLESTITFAGQVQKRSDYASLLYDLCELSLINAEDSRLTVVERPVPFYQADHPRMMLIELSKGPQPYDLPKDTLPVMAEDIVKDAAIIGLSLADNVLLVNFSDAFLDVFAGEDAEQERLLAYALTNTLCGSSLVEQVQFFVSGKPFTGFTGTIVWETRFSPLF